MPRKKHIKVARVTSNDWKVCDGRSDIQIRDEQQDFQINIFNYAEIFKIVQKCFEMF